MKIHLLKIIICIIFNVLIQFYIPKIFWHSNEYKNYEYDLSRLENWNKKYAKEYALYEAEKYLFYNRGETVQTVELLKSFYSIEDHNLSIKDRAIIARDKVWRLNIHGKNIDYVVCYTGVQCLFTDYLSSFNDTNYLIESFQGKHLENFDIPEKPAVNNFAAKMINIPGWYFVCIVITNIILGYFLFVFTKTKIYFEKLKKSIFNIYLENICYRCGK